MPATLTNLLYIPCYLLMKGYTMWTVDSVKECLPDVDVEDIVTGLVRTMHTVGRRCPFCGVWDTEHRLTYSWDAVANALNTETPLVF